MAIVTIIGAGMMGSALAFPLTDNGHTVRLVGTPLDREIITSVTQSSYHPTLKMDLPPVVPFQIEDWEQAVEGADLILCGVSSFGVEWFSTEILPKLSAGVPVLAVTKGLLHTEEGVISFPEYYESLMHNEKQIDFCAVGGPCTSYELAQRQHSFVTYCGRDLEVLEQARKLLSTEYYHISLSTDVRGVEAAVALKNAYALGVSLAIGQTNRQLGEEAGQRYNPQAALFSQSVTEIRRLLQLFGGEDANISIAAGDLYVTIFGGRTRRLGTLLGEGLTFAEAISKLEGVTLESVAITTVVAEALEALIEQGTAAKKDFPLLLHVNDLINHGKTVEIPWKAFELSGRE